MKRIVHQRFRARQDLIEIVRYYAREAGVKTARRFLTQAETTFQKLAEMPGRGWHMRRKAQCSQESAFARSSASYRI